VVLFLHNRYRTTGGEERVVADLVRLVREELGEDAEVLERDSARLGRARAAAGLLGGGLDPGEVGAAVRRTGARVVHAHNLLPAFGPRALAAARAAGARTVLHLHNFRLVCAVGTCFTRGEDCTRCHGRDTRPGVRLNCRGTGPEAVVYGAGLALHGARMAAHADAVVVPSAAAAARLRALGAPLGDVPVHVVAHPVRPAPGGPVPDGPALVAGRLAPEKGVEVAVEACRRAGVPLVVAGDGPLAGDLRRLAPGATFTGPVDAARLRALRARAGVAVVPSRSAETFGLAAAEAMAAGLPVAASAIGALPELAGPGQLAPPGDPAALAAVVARVRGDAGLGAANRERIAALAAPAAVAARLAAVYAGEPPRTRAA
jgi:glycosyltransferase involved in cell wall biosynthesis